MKIPFSLPGRFGDRPVALLAGSAAVVVALLFCVVAATVGIAPQDTVPAPATAETAETATPETAETAQLPTTADTTATQTVGTVLPQTADAGRTYLDETLFIGDSNTARYLMYAD